jgi:VCBS repeat protein/FG-GAP repeat protein
MKSILISLSFLVSSASFAQCVSLTPIRTIAVSPEPFSIAAADLNGDGTDEVIIGSAAGILWNVAEGNASREVVPDRFATSGYRPSFATGDTNGQPGDELAIADGLGARLLERHRDGTWSRIDYPIGGTLLGIGIADVAGDGRGEVLIVSWDQHGPARLNVFSGHSPELLSARDIPLSQFYSFINMDVDHDGRADLIVTGSGAFSPIHHQYWPTETGFISIFARGIDSLGMEQRIADGQAFMTPVIGDFDGDGLDDILIGRYFKDFLLFRGKRDGGFASAVTYSAGDPGWSIPYYTAADIDDDGVADLIRIAGDVAGSVQVLAGTPNGPVMAGELPLHKLWAPPIVVRTPAGRVLAVPMYDGTIDIVAIGDCRSKRRAATH